MKVTKEGIEAKIIKKSFTKLPDSTVTICAVTMKNGFVAIGKSACVDPLLFDIEVGATLAYDDAFEQLWALEGYLLAEEMSKL